MGAPGFCFDTVEPPHLSLPIAVGIVPASTILLGPYPPAQVAPIFRLSHKLLLFSLSAIHDGPEAGEFFNDAVVRLSVPVVVPLLDIF